ncbi:MAG: hypothetical protein COU22_00605 [Candidatus Komeilibacteria bacterium CG10_big_fil_rev_8_21_14_0_10_41_13]|uniref:DUF2238 domain-containing protein n=1 Tax=Candidatus Komeilibacteria bacterium CG10_big_fil_rev_8_21_14_0_10_41_13 TaxID=1974476 RepID=A0A2M6WD60_9BACT|nr:MAG: hypothetical protein COU22_00605 [Candidatus Komeilibacteria bacterium CG10_big_fil_rev_8_21_14_0_10_41_13]
MTKEKSFILKRRIISIVLYVLAFSLLIFLFFGDYLKVGGYAFSIALIMLPFYIYSYSKRLKNFISLEYIQLIQMVIAIASFFNLLGSLAGYYNPTYQGYDKFVHFINPLMIFCVSPIFVAGFQNFFFSKISRWFVIVANFVFIIFGSFVWEFYEYFIDSLFENSHMLGNYGEVYFDTLYDLLYDFAGGLLASIFIYFYFYNYLIKQINFKKRQ